MEKNKRLSGILNFYGLQHPWSIGGVDAFEILNNFYKKLENQYVSRIETRDTYSILVDKNGKSYIWFNDYGVIFLMNKDEIGWSNETAYFGRLLEWLNGRNIELLYNDMSFTIKALDEPEFNVYFTHNNSCALTDEIVIQICKPKQPDTCIFLGVSGGGWECLKFSSLGRVFLDRLYNKKMNAARIGSCMCIGRKE
jgi:hypothetical protein